jgi:glucose-1-phosphate thymidylyltransferase
MKAIVLCGGFAKRMWPLTMNRPKHLLPINGKPMLEYVLQELETINDFSKIYISTNEKFASQFQKFLNTRKNKVDIELVVEPTKSEQEKLGSVGSLGKLIRDKNINEPVLIIGGDNLFEFNMIELVKHLEAKKENIIVTEDVKDFEKAKLYGIVEVDNNHKVLGFEEKPQNPKSTLASTACYILTAEGVQGLLKYLSDGNDPDKMGHFVQWLILNKPVYAFRFDGRWFDIGDLQEYHQADDYFRIKGGGFARTNVIILAAGYATRLYPLTLDTPKPLLPIGGIPILERIMMKINPVHEIGTVFVVTNSKFSSHFENWRSDYETRVHDSKPIIIVDDGTSTNETRRGVVGEIDFVLRNYDLEGDIMVVGGDNLFELNLSDVYRMSAQKNGSVVAVYDVHDIESAKLYGVVISDSNNKIVDFEEKPQNPKSTLASTLIYVLKHEDVHSILDLYARTPKDKEIKAGEAIIELLRKGSNVYCYSFDSGWYDIGSHEELKRADEIYSKK